MNCTQTGRSYNSSIISLSMLQETPTREVGLLDNQIQLNCCDKKETPKNQTISRMRITSIEWKLQDDSSYKLLTVSWYFLFNWGLFNLNVGVIKSLSTENCSLSMWKRFTTSNLKQKDVNQRGQGGNVCTLWGFALWLWHQALTSILFWVLRSGRE